MGKVLRETRIVHAGGQVGIHWCDVDATTRIVQNVDPEPIRLALPSDGTRTQYLDLIDLLMDALASHRSAALNMGAPDETDLRDEVFKGDRGLCLKSY